MEDQKEKERYHVEVYSEQVRAGRRTYFFDIKATRANDYFICITESKRTPRGDSFTYEKHKIFLYKEDFDKFFAALTSSIKRAREEIMAEEAKTLGKFSDYAEKDRQSIQELEHRSRNSED